MNEESYRKRQLGTVERMWALKLDRSPLENSPDSVFALDTSDLSTLLICRF